MLSSPGWYRLLFLILIPYIAVLPVLLWPSKTITIEHLPPRTTIHPCEGTSAMITLARRPQGTDPGRAVDIRRGWRRFESSDFAIESNLTAAEIQSLARTLNAVVPRLEETFGLVVRRPIRLKVFLKPEEFRSDTGSRNRSLWDQDRDEIVLARLSTASALAQILHWLVHRAVRSSPAWIEEGLAELAAHARIDGDTLSFEPPSVPGALDWAEVPSKEARSHLGRRRAASLLHFLMHRHGPWVIRHLLQGGPPENVPGWNERAEEESRARSFYR